MKILAISDLVVDWIYSTKIRSLFSDIDLVIGCGDLPQNYLEFIVSTLDIPMFYVHGNHTHNDTIEMHEDKISVATIDLHRRVKRVNGYTFAGVEGCIKYSNGKYQYSQFDMWLHVFHLVPPLLMNRINFGRYLNVFVTHAPPWGIQDQSDFAHQGIKAFRWLLDHFNPDYHLHGHIHIYRPDMVPVTISGKTKVINAYGYKKIDV